MPDTPSIENLDVAFARHKGDTMTDTSPSLWEQRRVGIHWEDIASADPDDYEVERGRKEIRNLNKVANDGALVAASFRVVSPTKMLIGVVPPDSTVDILFFRDDTIVETRSVEPGEALPADDNLADCIIEKTVQLYDAKVVRRENFPVLFDDGVRPRSWSICAWPKCQDHVRAAFNQDYAPFDVGSLQTDELETVCEEFLRTVNPDYRNLTPIGGRTSDVDIVGRDERGTIYAQVTGGDQKTVERKLDKLVEHTEEGYHVIMFAPADSEPAEMPDEVTFLPVESAFEALTLNPSGERLLDHMLPGHEGLDDE